MKTFLAIVVFLFGSVSLAEGSILEEFSISPRFAIGLGHTPMSDKRGGYANIKLNLINFGEEHVGMKFLGFGYGAGNEGSGFLFSPSSFNVNKWLVSFDIFGNNASQAGISLNRSF